MNSLNKSLLQNSLNSLTSPLFFNEARKIYFPSELNWGHLYLQNGTKFSNNFTIASRLYKHKIYIGNFSHLVCTFCCDFTAAFRSKISSLLHIFVSPPGRLDNMDFPLFSKNKSIGKKLIVYEQYARKMCSRKKKEKLKKV